MVPHLALSLPAQFEEMSGGLSQVLGPATLGAFFFLAAYLNLNDPDWLLWSTAYALGALICFWTALRGTTASAEGTGVDVARTRRYARQHSSETITTSIGQRGTKATSL